MLTALGASADPTSPLRQLHRIDGGGPSHRGPDAGPLAAMRADAGVRAALAAVLGASITLGDDLVANPTRWHAVRDLDLATRATRSHGADGGLAGPRCARPTGAPCCASPPPT